MERKADLKADGCFARALPDEPMFILLARDRCAPSAIRRWADVRTRLAIAEDWSEDAERINDALETAEAMETWRAENEGAWRNGLTDTQQAQTDLRIVAERILARRQTSEVPVHGEKFDSLLADAKKLAAIVLEREEAANADH